VDADTGQTILDLIFLYEGWNLIAEVNAQTGNLIRTYVWGLDLSGTMQGAGGIGGLLWVNLETGSQEGRYVVAYDGNGNVIGLVSASDGSVVAQYAVPLQHQILRPRNRPLLLRLPVLQSEVGEVVEQGSGC